MSTKEKNYSPLNTSINSIKCIDKDTPLQPVKNRKIKASLTNNKLLNDNYNTQMNNNNRCNIFETKRRLRTSRPKSEKFHQENKVYQIIKLVILIK